MPLAAALLAGCTTSGESTDEKLGRGLVSPGKYVIYNCRHLALVTGGIVARQKQLEELKAKAGPSPVGRAVALTTYEAEYLQTQGELGELRRAAAEKNCKFVPGVSQPPAR